MKLFSTTQIKEIDKLTIEKELICSEKLMERAADSIFRWFAGNISSENKILVFAGSGNNGGDGLALARMLIETGYSVEVYLIESNSLSSDCYENLNRLKSQGVIIPYIIKCEEDFPEISPNSLVVDSLFGTGLTRPIAGFAAKLIERINSSKARIISIDMPSGLFGEYNPFPNSNTVIEATVTLTLQFPKLSFFFPENYKCIGELIVIPIGLHTDTINSTQSPYYYLDISIIASIAKPRNRFSHKGNYGHCLIIAGSKGMMGAAVLASSSCIKTGSGLVTVHVPRIGYSILQQSIPEVMVNEDLDENYFTSINSSSKYTAIAIGPGLGRSQATVIGFINFLKDVNAPLIIDADGLNILAENRHLFDLIPALTILTPHSGEFDRLFGRCNSGYQRLIKAIEQAVKYKIVIVLKGAYSQIVCPDGKVYFNSTGNPGMATGGSGDVLTGIITSFRGQGYDSITSSLLGVYFHGLAGDIAAEKRSVNTITASDIIYYLGDAFNLIFNSKNEKKNCNTNECSAINIM